MADDRHRSHTVWLFDLDDTLHDAANSSMRGIHERMGGYMVEHLGMSGEEADRLRRRYWLKYGATLLGLVRHHGVKMAHFLHHTHILPGLEAQLRRSAHDLHALARLPGRRYVLTNAPQAYAARVMDHLGMSSLFEGVIAIEDMRVFGRLRPKPDTRMLRHVARRLGVKPARCVLVEDTLGHLKAARSIGMGTVWMQRWLPRPGRGAEHLGPNPAKARRIHRCPAYVDRRISQVQQLRRG